MYGAILEGYAAVIGENGKVIKSRIGRKGARAVLANKAHTVVLYPNKTVRFYRTMLGVDRGQVGRDGAINIHLKGDRLAISYKDGETRIYNLRKRALASAQRKPRRKGGIYESTDEKLKAYMKKNRKKK